MITLTRYGYVNHTHPSAPDAAGNVYFAVTHRRADQPDKPTNVEIVQRRPDGSLAQIHTFTEAACGKAGYGGVTPLPNGDLFYVGSHHVDEEDDPYAARQAIKLATLRRGDDGVWREV